MLSVQKVPKKVFNKCFKSFQIVNTKCKWSAQDILKNRKRSLQVVQQENTKDYKKKCINFTQSAKESFKKCNKSKQ